MVGTARVIDSYDCASDPFESDTTPLPGCPAGETRPAVMSTFESPAGKGVRTVDPSTLTTAKLDFKPVLPSFMKSGARYYADAQTVGVAGSSKFGLLFLTETSSGPTPLERPSGVTDLREIATDNGVSGWTFTAGRNRVLMVQTAGVRIILWVQGTSLNDVDVDALASGLSAN